MTKSNRVRVMEFATLVIVSMGVTAMTRQALAVFPCDFGGSTNSCRYGAGNPCYVYQSTNCGDYNFNGSTSSLCSYSYDPTQNTYGSYFTPTSFVTGDWYRCTTVAGSGTGACTENLKLCMNMDIYRSFTTNGSSNSGYPGSSRTCTNKCGTDTYYNCQAGSGAPICGSYGQP